METMEEMDLLIKSELEKCGIPTDNLDGAVTHLRTSARLITI